MAVSRSAGQLLSTVSPPVPSRWRGCPAERDTDFVSCFSHSARRALCGRLFFSARDLPRFSNRGVARMNGSKEGAAFTKAGEHLKSKSKTTGENRKVCLFASSSSTPSPLSYTEEPTLDHGEGGNGFTGRGGGGGGGGGGGEGGFGGSDSSGAASGGSAGGGGILGSFIRGWDARVKADQQFPFKVLMEQVVGVGACLIGDMSSRPNFGINELDLVFSTLVVGSILNFSLMYMLAPTAAAGAVASKLPGLFSGSPPGHMFEIGSYSLLERAGTFVYKGSQFAVVGFFAGLVGTGLSSALIGARKKVDPDYVPQSATPPTFLNAVTWAIHMGFSSNGRYQALNGLEFALAKSLSPGLFKASVPILRALNNVLGGSTFVLLARVTGSQPKTPTGPPQGPHDEESSALKSAVPSS